MAKNLWNMFKIFEIIFSAWVMIMSHDKSAISLSIIAVPWFSQKSHFATHTWFSRFSYLQLKMISLCWLYSNCSYSINVKKSEFKGSLWPYDQLEKKKNWFLDMGDQFLRDLVGNAATCVTIIMFLCPMPTIGQINRQKAVPHGFNVYPYAFTAVLATLWWYYGAIIQVYTRK